MTSRKRMFHRKILGAMPWDGLKEAFAGSSDGVREMTQAEICDVVSHYVREKKAFSMGGVDYFKYSGADGRMALVAEADGFELYKALLTEYGFFGPKGAVDVSEDAEHQPLLRRIIERNKLELIGMSVSMAEKAQTVEELYDNGRKPPFKVSLSLAYLKSQNRSAKLYKPERHI